MNEIIDDARKNIDIFISKLKNHDENEWAFQVKYPFQIENNTSYNVEHIWLSDIFIKENKYYGIVRRILSIILCHIKVVIKVIAAIPR